MFCLKHMTVRNLQMNRCLDVYQWFNEFFTQITWLFKTSRWTDVWMFYSTLFLLRSNAYLKLTDEQMFGCLPKIKSDFLLRSIDCLKPPDEQMFFQAWLKKKLLRLWTWLSKALTLVTILIIPNYLVILRVMNKRVKLFLQNPPYMSGLDLSTHQIFQKTVNN